jgi:V/A-type H+-transporting ATPase subunit C
MSSLYTYAGTRAKTLERKLLSETQLELLVSAKSVKEMHKVLHDTYLAPHLNKKNGDTILHSIDESVAEAKRTLTFIAPEPEALDVLWIKYDFHNLKTIIKGKRAGISDDDIINGCYDTGTIDKHTLLKHYNERALNRHNTYLKDAAERAEQAEHVFDIDLITNTYYFEAIRTIAQQSKDAFTQEYVTLLIDLFNIKAALRSHALEGIELKDVYIEGGTLNTYDLESKENILKILYRFGGDKRWVPAIERAEKTGRYNRLEKAADEYVTDFLKEKSTLVFTSASLFSYFNAQKNNAQIVSAILTAKKVGMKEKDLRDILRRRYA